MVLREDFQSFILRSLPPRPEDFAAIRRQNAVGGG